MTVRPGDFNNADAYELQMGRWSRQLAEPFLDFAGPINGNRILDMGCGIGSLTFAVARRNKSAKISGIDAAAPFVEHLSQINTDPRIDVQVGDALALPFPDKTFDHALTLLVLHFVSDTATAVSELKRVTKPGGTIAAAVWDTGGGFIAQRMFFDTAAAIDPKAQEARAHHMRRPNTRKGELAAAWHAGGLADVEESSIMTRMEYASFDDYWKPFLGRQAGAAAYIAKLPAGEVDRIREAVRLAYLAGDPDGPRSFVAVAWAVKGKVPS
jgi:SAM-dependent methyltransferase